MGNRKMAKLFDAVNRLRKVEEATSSRDEPPPVYLLDEIWEMAREGGDSAISIAEHLNRNLGNRSPVVKWKALRVIKHLCGRGAPQFQRSMQRFASSIRELTHYKGDPDPFKGDANNARVRDLANEVLAILYTTSAPSHTSSLQGRIQGFGSSMPPPPGSGSTGGRMMAFGSNTGGVPTGGWGPSGASSSYSSSAAPAPAANNRGGFMGNSQTAPSHNRTGSFGDNTVGGARGNGMTASLTATSNSSGYFGPPPTSSSSNRSGSGATHAPSTMLGTEQGVVDDITASGGLRATPTPEDLKQFVEAASNLDGLKIAELMMGKLKSSNAQIVLRTLCALEAVLQQGMTQACGEIAVMFQSDPGCVRAALSSPQQAVRQQAAKCLKLLVNEDIDSEAGRGATAGGASQAGSGFPDLMGGGVDSTPAAAQPQQKPTPAADPFDLLGDLSVPAPVPAVATAAPVTVSTNHLDLLGSPGPAARPAAPGGLTVPPVPAAFDPFAPLGAPAATSVPAVQPALQSLGQPGLVVPAVQNKPATTAAPLDDIFSSLTVSAGGQVSLGPGLHTAGLNSFQQAPLGQQQQFQGGLGGWGVPPTGVPGPQPGMLGANGGASFPFGDLGLGKPQGPGQQVQAGLYMQQQQQQQRPLAGVGGSTSSWQSSLPGTHARAEQDRAFDFVKDAFH